MICYVIPFGSILNNILFVVFLSYWRQVLKSIFHVWTPILLAYHDFSNMIICLSRYEAKFYYHWVPLSASQVSKFLVFSLTWWLNWRWFILLTSTFFTSCWGVVVKIITSMLLEVKITFNIRLAFCKCSRMLYHTSYFLVIVYCRISYNNNSKGRGHY